MGDDTQNEPTYRPDRYFILSDAGSQYWDPATGEGADGFQTPAAAARWALAQAHWSDLPELLADGVSAIIALGADLNASLAAWDEWDGEGDWPDVPAVGNHARDIPGLVTDTPTDL